MKKFTISGNVIPVTGDPATKFTITAFNKNLRSETTIGEAPIGESGAFNIFYEPVFRKNEYKTADVFFRLYDGKKEIKDFTVSEVTVAGKISLPDGILFNVGESVEVEIRLIEPTINKNFSEFEEIASLILPLLDDTPIEVLNENKEHKDFSFLSRETGLDNDKIIRFALSHRLAVQSGIEAEFWYALTSGRFYQDLSRSFTDQNLDVNLPMVIAALFLVTSASTNEIVKQAFDSNLISSKLSPRLSKWIKQFLEFKIKRISTPEKNDQMLFIKSLMESAGLTIEMQEKFLSIYLNHGAFDEAFWKELSAKKGLDDNEIRKLQFANSLSKLDGDNEKLVTVLPYLPGISSLRELALKHDAQSLSDILTPAMLPENVEGKTTTEKISNYASQLQQQIFAQQTSAVLQRMATVGELPIKDDHVRKGVADFLANQPEFNIRTTSVYNAIKTDGAFKGIADKHHDEVSSHLQKLQRVQAISPSPEAMTTLLNANFVSAHQVAEIPHESFMTAFSKKMGAGVANQIHAKATDIKIRNEHTLMSLQEVVKGSGIAAIDGGSSIEERKNALNTKAAEKNIPVDWETLFGNVDFCECGECTSVYSPAAYFVELLQYLRNNDLDPNEKGVLGIKPDPKDISGTVLEKLFRRRPDLGCLELTCANTNTILPYVDLVNEVMESFIVHLDAYSKSALDPKEAVIEPWNVEDETSGELLAQPQHINNDAYLELKKTVYPFTLPYDRPVDMIRIFLQYLDTSRYELMKTFRAVEQNTISKEVMPEDTNLPVSPSPDPQIAKIPAFNKIISDRAIDAESLSITQEEYIILTKEAFLTKDYFNLSPPPGITDGQYRIQIGVKAVPEYYGYTGKNAEADMLSLNETLQGGLAFVKKQFLKRTGLLYADLVELLKTQSLNPLYPSGKPLVVLESIPFSYRFLQGLVDKSNPDPEIKFKKVIDALVHPQDYIPGYDDRIDTNPCKTGKKTRPAFISADIKQWVLCYFERIGQMIVLESGTMGCDCIEGHFVRKDGTDNIQVGNAEGKLSLNADCDLFLAPHGGKLKAVNVGHVDSMTGLITLTDVNGKSIDVSILTRNNVKFNGNKGELGIIKGDRLINEHTERPFGCKQPKADNCDLSRVRLKHLDGSSLWVTEYDKIQRFIRLWRKMGWSVSETDRALVGLTAAKTTFTRGFKDACDPEVDPKGFAEITPDFLHQLSAVEKLLDKTGLELIKLLAFWTDISTTGEKSLYERLFLTHNLLAIDDVFKADENGNYLTKPAKIADHIPVLMGAFNVKYEDIDPLVAATDPLNLSTISQLYRSCLLAKQLHIKTTDLKQAFLLFNSDPFQNADSALEFFDKWDKMDDAGFTFAQLNYVINNIEDFRHPLAPSENFLVSLSKSLYDGLNAINDAHLDLPLTDELTIKLLSAVPTAAAKKQILQKLATEELVRSKISLLFDQLSVELIMGLLQGTFSYSITVPKNLVSSADKFSKAFPDGTPALKQASALLIKKLSYDFKAGILRITGLLTAQELNTLTGLFKSNPGWKPSFVNINDQAQSIFDDLLAVIFKNDMLNAVKTLLGGDIKDPDNSDLDSAPVKREYFLEIFLPLLRDKLKENFLITTLADAASLDADVTAVLIADILKGASAKSLMAIFKDANKPVTGIGWKGYLVPAADDDYVFAVKDFTKPFSLQTDGKDILDDKFPLAKGLFISGVQKLKAGQPYLLDIAGLPADLNNVNWSTAISPKSPIARQVLLPMEAVQTVEEGFIKIFKTAIIIRCFPLTAAEISWLQNHGVDFDNLDFNAVTLQHLLRLEAFTRLRDALPAADLTLIDFFKWANTAALSALPAEQIALLILRKKEDIDAMIARPHFNLLKPNDFSNEVNLLKLLDAFAVYDKINMKIDMLFDWAQPVSRFSICQTIAETIRKSIQARYKQEDWEQVIKPLNDQLREHQKQALINCLLVKTELIAWGVVDADSLFEFFLIDVQMDACMLTSRLKQAISSVQLFVERCFLGEEASRGVPNNILDRERWNWMQWNSLWVANRKAFLYPENLVLGYLRDDKSSCFKDLESELLQKDFNNKSIAEALKSYLTKVDEISNMKVIGLFIEESVANKISVGDKIHVFSRTRSTPSQFYYRHYKTDERNWVPWEKLQIDIPTYNLENGNHEILGNGCYLVPIVFGKRLLIFFPQITQKTKQNDQSKNQKVSGIAEADSKDVKPITYWEIKMAWSEYRNGAWTKKQVCDDAIYHPDGGGSDLSLPISQNPDISGYAFVPSISPIDNYFFIFIYYNKTLINSGRYNNFIFMDGHLKKQSINLVQINTGYPDNFHYGADKQPTQIHSLQRAGTSFGFEVKNPFFSDESSGELYHSLSNEVIGFYYPYSHNLLNRIQVDDLTDFFSFNLSIKDEPSTTFNELFEAFGKDQSGNNHELKAPYALYNWELFFHGPLTIAKELSSNQQFEEAINWYHYVFNPTAKGTDAKRFWQFLPFKDTGIENSLENIFNALQPNKPDEQISEWRDNPFQPHMIARSRPSAYMKFVVMEYIDTCIAWGDYFFRQDTIESLNYATQLYIRAWHIMGQTPQMIPRQGKIKPETYNSLLDKWDAFGNAIVELEVIAPFSQQTSLPVSIVGGSTQTATANIFGFASSLYFCVPNNPKLMGYWDTIADRLYKIRHCENIEGVFRMLPLWDPAIDPALLVAATAQGLSLDSVLNDLNTPLPNYRFIYLLQKAIDLCNEVKSLGNLLLSVSEKIDTETIAIMRASHETAMHNLVMEVKKMQVEEANRALEGLQQNRITTEYKLRHYLQLVGEDLSKIPSTDVEFSEIANQLPTPSDEGGLKLIKEETEEMDKAAQALEWQIVSSGTEVLSSVLHALPDIVLSVMPLGLGVQSKYGGSHLGHAASGAAKVLQTISSIYSFESSSAQRKAGFRRQLQDRILQANLAGYECMQIDKQITTQQIRINISDQEITNQQKMIDHSAEVEAFIKDKFTNEELYKWMKGQLKTVHRQMYDLACDWAKKAERVFCFERGLTNISFLQSGGWDASHDGLLSGERLYLGLKQLEAAYHENRGHDFEVIKHISLQQLDPLALIEVRETGKTEFSIPEIVFDMDFPGHYMRRIKSVALSIPCIAGPYTSVNATLRLQEHSYRISSIATNQNDYPRKTGEDDDRFSTAHVPIDSIATSSGQHDSGLFELNFKDERYMPFEGAGAISTWHLELPDTFRQFNYDTISDIIVHLSYTSKDGGDKLKRPATETLKSYFKRVEDLSQREGLFAMFDIKRDFSNEWYKAMMLPPGANGRLMELGNLSEKLSLFTRNSNIKKIHAKDIYLATDASLKTNDLTIILAKKAIASSMDGPEKLNDTNLYHFSDLDLSMNNIGDKWSLSFSNSIKEPEKMLMIVRYALP